jgi:UDP-N-acetylmuramyl pentapeptide phosphotransferase/UDP-N-acetylglucosamine-1-phosphate transferase
VNGFLAAVLALVMALALTPVAIWVLRRWQVMDVPNSRSSHDRPTVRGGGLALLAAAAIAMGVVTSEPASLRLLVLVVATALGALGFIDDLRQLPSGVRLLLTIVIAAIPIALVVDRPLGFAPGFGVLVAALFVAAYVNAFNFMDGINGISAFQAIVAGSFISAAGAVDDHEVLLVGGLAIAGAALGFLPYNFPTAVVFLGDVGSYGIGGWLAIIGIISATEVSPVLPMALAAIYGADTASTVLRRLRRREQIWVSHREHTYQRLCGMGWSHAASAVTVALFTAVCGLLGLLTSQRGLAVGMAGLIGVTVICLVYLSLPVMVRRHAAHETDLSTG